MEDLPSLPQVLLAACGENLLAQPWDATSTAPLVPSADKEWWQVPERWRCSDTHQAGRHSNPGAEHAGAGVMPSSCGYVTTVLSWQSLAAMLEPEPGPVTPHQHLWALPIHSPQLPPLSLSPNSCSCSFWHRRCSLAQGPCEDRAEPALLPACAICHL